MSRFVAGRKIFRIGMRVKVSSVVSKPNVRTIKSNWSPGWGYLLRLVRLVLLEGDRIVGVRLMWN